MPKFIVYASVTQYLQTEIEADTLDDAELIADDLITDDFEQAQAEFKLGEILCISAN